MFVAQIIHRIVLFKKIGGLRREGVRMIKVLMIVKALEKTGVTSVMMSYFDYIDKNAFQMDFACGDLYDIGYKNHILENGGKFYSIPKRDTNLLGYIWKLASIIRSKKYDIVHVHGNSAMIFPELLAAKIAGTPVRIAHSHNTQCNHPKIEKFVRPIFNALYSHGIGCSQEAGQWMFGDADFTVIKNGTDTVKFAFDERKRKIIRQSIAVMDDEYLIGHVGYFNNQKNQDRIIEIAATMRNMGIKVKILLIGDGYRKSVIEEKTKKLGIDDIVIFYGNSNNVQELMSAMDVFLFPSLFEGFPLVLLEAQASGLHCVSSDVVTHKTAEATNAVSFVDLQLNDEQWIKAINNAIKITYGKRSEKSKYAIEMLNQYGYDYRQIVKDLENYYQSIKGGRK